MPGSLAFVPLVEADFLAHTGGVAIERGVLNPILGILVAHQTDHSVTDDLRQVISHLGEK
jgi:hypothetical protein